MNFNFKPKMEEYQQKLNKLKGSKSMIKKDLNELLKSKAYYENELLNYACKNWDFDKIESIQSILKKIEQQIENLTNNIVNYIIAFQELEQGKVIQSMISDLKFKKYKGDYYYNNWRNDKGWVMCKLDEGLFTAGEIQGKWMLFEWKGVM